MLISFSSPMFRPSPRRPCWPCCGGRGACVDCGACCCAFCDCAFCDCAFSDCAFCGCGGGCGDACCCGGGCCCCCCGDGCCCWGGRLSFPVATGVAGVSAVLTGS